MSELSDKILNILLEENIKHENILDEIYNIQQDISCKLWEKISISSMIFYTLKDTVFYNFEHLPGNSNQLSGKSTMKFYGSKYPILMYNTGSNSPYILKEHLPQLLNELNGILSKWNNQIYLANLISKNEFDWIGGDKDPSSIIFYDKETENPKKYGYFTNMDILYNNILYDVNGNKLQKEEENIILCPIKKIDLYREYNSLTNTLNILINKVKLAINLDKGLLLDFDSYDYKN